MFTILKPNVLAHTQERRERSSERRRTMKIILRETGHVPMLVQLIATIIHHYQKHDNDRN